MEKVFQGCTHTDEEVQEKSFQTLVEIGKTYYDFIDGYFTQIAQMTG